MRVYNNLGEEGDDVSLLDHAIQVISEKKSRVNSRKGKIRFVLLVLHKGREKWRRRRRRRLPSNLSLSFWQPIKRTANRSHGTLLISSGAEERIDTEEPKGARGLNSNPPISSPSPPPLEFAFLDAFEPTGDPGEELTFPLLSFLEGDTFFSRFDSLGTKLLLSRETKEIGFRIEQSQSQF